MIPITEDWRALVGRLERYYRHLDIGLECGRSESWVGLLRRGIILEPPHSIGEKLKAMDRDLAARTQDPQVIDSG